MIAFAFAGTNSEKVLRAMHFPGIEKLYIKSSYSALHQFIERLRITNPSIVLGMGLYSRNANFIRIETNCHNEFRGEVIIEDGDEEIVMSPYFEPNTNLRRTKEMGNSWCNLVCYNIMTVLEVKNFAFLHIPKNYDIELAAKAIEVGLEHVLQTT